MYVIGRIVTSKLDSCARYFILVAYLNGGRPCWRLICSKHAVRYLTHRFEASLSLLDTKRTSSSPCPSFDVTVSECDPEMNNWNVKLIASSIYIIILFLFTSYYKYKTDVDS
jgi:hypothetical protein